MNIAVTGGTGFIGKHLVRYLVESGHQVAVISRSQEKKAEGAVTLTWDQLENDPAVWEGWQAIINLAGETINQRWTRAAQDRILGSRLEACQRVARWVERMDSKPSVVVNGSGINIYGTSETDEFDERSPGVQTDFLSGVVTRWEQAADQIPGVRIVKVRTGLVLGMDGGALPSMSLPYKLGAGGRVGNGRQWVSWIHIRDMVRILEFAVMNEPISGSVNATSPDPVTNDEFGRTLGRVMGRPHWLPVPAIALKLALGELSDLLLKGQRVMPKVLAGHGFRFEYPDLNSALSALFDNN